MHYHKINFLHYIKYAKPQSIFFICLKVSSYLLIVANFQNVCNKVIAPL